MSRCLVVGCDNLGVKPRQIKERFGVQEVIHWDGRSAKMPKKLPKNTKIVIVYSGFVNHSLMFAVRELAKKAGARTVFLKRGFSELNVLQGKECFS